MNKENGQSIMTINECTDFPLKVTEDTLDELGTLINCDEITGKDIPDDMLEALTAY